MNVILYIHALPYPAVYPVKQKNLSACSVWIRLPRLFQIHGEGAGAGVLNSS